VNTVDIFSILILFFVISGVVNLIKRASQPAKKAQKQAMTQPQYEVTKRAAVQPPVQKPAPKPADFRFPPAQKSFEPKQPVYQQGRDPDAVVTANLSQYQSITPSADLDILFSDYKGSLDATRSEGEGEGYQTERYEGAAAAYQSSALIEARVLPEVFNRNSLIQAVVMSEILKRPGASRR
jgi:hypothetical protein